MRTDFTSEQSVEVVTGNASHEPVFMIGLHCTAWSTHGFFDHISGAAEPPCGPEFELTSIAVSVPVVNPVTREVVSRRQLNLTWDEFMALVGEDIANELLDKAEEDAAENGGF